MGKAASAGHFWATSGMYPMTILIGDVAAASAWTGDKLGVTCKKSYAKPTAATIRLAKLDALVLDPGGIAHVGLVFRDGDRITIVETRDDILDPTSAAAKRVRAVADAIPAKPKRIGIVDVPSGLLVLADASHRFAPEWFRDVRKPRETGRGVAVDSDVLLLRIAPGRLTIDREGGGDADGVVRLSPQSPAKRTRRA